MRARLGGWAVVCEATVAGVERLVIEPAEPGPISGLSVRQLRDVDLQGALRVARLQLRPPTNDTARWGDFSDRPTTRIERLAALALEYSARVNEGVRDVAKALAVKHACSPTQIRDAIHAARNEGLLTKTGQGRPGGQPTALAMEILGAHFWRGVTEADRTDLGFGSTASLDTFSSRWLQRPPTKEDLWEWRHIHDDEGEEGAE